MSAVATCVQEELFYWGKCVALHVCMQYTFCWWERANCGISRSSFRSFQHCKHHKIWRISLWVLQFVVQTRPMASKKKISHSMAVEGNVFQPLEGKLYLGLTGNFKLYHFDLSIETSRFPSWPLEMQSCILEISIILEIKQLICDVKQ